MVNYKWLMVNVRESLDNDCHPEALEGRLYSYAFLITNCALILFLLNCDLKVKTNNMALFKLVSQFVTSGAPQVNAVGTPTLNPPVGTYNTDQQVTLSTATSGAAIYYTTDGTAPTASSTLYASAIPVAAHGTTKTIQAIAIKSGMTDSGIASGTYVIKYDSVAMPTMSPAAGTYSSSQSVALSTTTTGATIYYTLDGTTPTTSSTQYTGAISLSVGGSTTNLQAIAVKTGMANSSVASGSYVMNFISSPTFSPTAGTYGSDQLVTIDTLTFGATIYYTLDGFTPTLSSSKYTSPISIAGNGTTKTIKAIAVKDGIPNSPLVTGTWTIDTTLAVVSINSVSPSTTVDGSTSPQINWQSNSAGTYIVKVGGTSCANGTTVTGTNVSGSILASTPMITTINSASLAGGSNTIRLCVQKFTAGNYGSVTQNIIKDTIAPIPGNSGTITTANVTSTSLTLNWTKATDTVTAQTSLQYKVVRSLSNNIDTVANAEANGTLVQNWTTDIATVNVSGLTANTAHYFNVLVKDSFGNKEMYNVVQSNQEKYSWGTFTDNFNGTIRFDGVAGTFGGNIYTSQTLTFMKCSQGQSWNSGTNTCDGSAGTWQFCTTNDNNCNGGVTTNELGVGGFLSGSTSGAYNQCNSIGTYAGKTGWRVPKKDELKTLIHCNDKTMPDDTYFCLIGNYTSPSINNLFPNTIANDYWSSTTYAPTTINAWRVYFNGGGVYGVNSKTNTYYVRCVSGP